MEKRLQLLHDAFRPVFVSHLQREPNAFGMSGIGFCLDKLRLGKIHVDEIPLDTNGKMVIGTLHHELLPKVLENHPYGLFHVPKNWLNPAELRDFIHNKPVFEKIVKYDSGEGWVLEGHCDIDLPAVDCIIEYKTTGMKKVATVDDPVISAYILQANGYAYNLGRKRWEIWIVYKDFNSVHEDFVQIISGDTSEEIWEEARERISWVWEAIQNDGELAGPEMDWECSGCPTKKWCEKIKKKYATIVSILPCSRGEIIAATNESMFKFFYNKKWILYDRNNKGYSLADNFKEEYGFE